MLRYIQWNITHVQEKSTNADLAANETVSLKVIGEAAAGHPFGGVILPGQAVQILTGAPLPAGADTIVMQEFCVIEGNSVRIPKQGRSKHHGLIVLPEDCERVQPGDLLEFIPLGAVLG